MKGNRVGFVTHLASPEVTVSDAFIVSSLERLGFVVCAAPWDSLDLNWQSFDVLVLRSCWNYHTNLIPFLKWLERMEQVKIPIWNSPSTVRWNIHKTYLIDLIQKNIPVIPTNIISKGTHSTFENIFEEMEQDTLVIKPAVGASAHEVHKIKANDQEHNLKLLSSLLSHSDVLVQPFMEEINDGEVSLIFIGKTFAHAVIKTPKRNEFRVNHNGTATLIDVDQFIIKQGQHILEQLNEPTLYARIDGIIVNNTFVLMELELIEPHLFIDLCHKTADLFASAFATIEE